MNGDTVKDLLKSTTSEAVEKGAFGLPYIVINKGKDHLGIDDDTYFGSDRFEVMASKLGNWTNITYVSNICDITCIRMLVNNSGINFRC